MIPVHTNKIKHYMKVGSSGRGWYDETFRHIKAKYGKDAGLFADILSATSANTTVKANVTLAKKAYKQLKTGKKFVGYLPVVVDMLHTIKVNWLTGVRALFGSRKIQQFADALRGRLSAVVVDRWMVRAFGYPDKVTPKRYREIEAWIIRQADLVGWKPAQIQAAIWTGVKMLTDTSGASAAPIESYL